MTNIFAYFLEASLGSGQTDPSSSCPSQCSSIDCSEQMQPDSERSEEFAREGADAGSTPSTDSSCTSLLEVPLPWNDERQRDGDAFRSLTFGDFDNKEDFMDALNSNKRGDMELVGAFEEARLTEDMAEITSGSTVCLNFRAGDTESLPDDEWSLVDDLSWQVLSSSSSTVSTNSSDFVVPEMNADAHLTLEDDNISEFSLYEDSTDLSLENYHDFRNDVFDNTRYSPLAPHARASYGDDNDQLDEKTKFLVDVLFVIDPLNSNPSHDAYLGEMAIKGKGKLPISSDSQLETVNQAGARNCDVGRKINYSEDCAERPNNELDNSACNARHCLNQRHYRYKQKKKETPFGSQIKILSLSKGQTCKSHSWQRKHCGFGSVAFHQIMADIDSCPGQRQMNRKLHSPISPRKKRTTRKLPSASSSRSRDISKPKSKDLRQWKMR